jgi:excisionase family DNA binding protein
MKQRDRLLTLREAASFLQLHARTVVAYIARGELRGRLIGRRWRFRQADLDRFFDRAPGTWDFGRESDPLEVALAKLESRGMNGANGPQPTR